MCFGRLPWVRDLTWRRVKAPLALTSLWPVCIEKLRVSL